MLPEKACCVALLWPLAVDVGLGLSSSAAGQTWYWKLKLIEYSFNLS
jgi:hypothetical protein